MNEPEPEPEQCIICLESLPRASSSDLVNGATNNEPKAGGDSTNALAEVVGQDAKHLDIVAALDGCEHVIHDACIRSWAQKTNTCPICRTPFHSVRVYNGADGMYNQQTPGSWQTVFRIR